MAGGGQHRQKKKARGSVALTGGSSPEAEKNNPIQPEVNTIGTNTPPPPTRMDKQNDPIWPNVKNEHTQTKNSPATSRFNQSVDEVLKPRLADRLDFSVSLPTTEPLDSDNSDNENSPKPIDIRLPFTQEKPEIAIVAQSRACQTDTLPSVTDHENSPKPIDIRLPFTQEKPEIAIVAQDRACQTDTLPSVTDHKNNPKPIDIQLPFTQKKPEISIVAQDRACQTDTLPSVTDHKNNPKPIDIQLPFTQKKPEIAIVAQDRACQTDTLPSVTDHDNKKIISPAQKIKAPTPEELMTKFKALVSCMGSNDQSKSIDFYENKTTELIEIHELLITPETSWVSVANIKDLRIISDNLSTASKLISETIEKNINKNNNDNSLIKLISTALRLPLIKFQTLTAYNKLLPKETEESIYKNYLSSVNVLCNLIQKIVKTSTPEEDQSLKNRGQLAKNLEINYKTIAETFFEIFPENKIGLPEILTIIARILTSLTNVSTLDISLYNIALVHALHLKQKNTHFMYLHMYWQAELFDSFLSDILVKNHTSYELFVEQLQTTKVSPSNFLRMPKLYTWLANISKHTLAAAILRKYLELINNKEGSKHFDQAIESGFTATANLQIIKQIYHSLTFHVPANHRVTASTRKHAVETTRLQLTLYDGIQECYQLFRSRKKVNCHLLDIEDSLRKERLHFWENVAITQKEEDSRWCTAL